MRGARYVNMLYGRLWGGVAWRMNCPRCQEPLSVDATVCPHCGAPLSEASHDPAAPAVYVPPRADDLEGPPTTPYARSRYAHPPVTRTVPLLNPIPATPYADSAHSAAHNGANATAAEDETTWANVPPLLTPAEPENVPFAMTPAPFTPAVTHDEPVSPTEATVPDMPTVIPDEDGLPAYETPDIERPAIHVPKPPLPDYDTPDEEHPAVHLPPPPLPDYDTPDEERTAAHPALASAQADGKLAPEEVSSEAETATPPNGPAQVPDMTISYPGSYAGPRATPVGGAAPGAPRTPPVAPRSAPQPAAGDAVAAVLERIFGEQPDPKARTANNAVQSLWQDYLPPEWAASPWISIPVGALLAVVAGLLVSIIGLLFWSHAIGYLLSVSNAASLDRDVVQAIFAPNLLQLFLLEHGVPMTLAFGASGAAGSFSAMETLPLTGLSLIPACALVLAGYVASASDFTHRLRFSVLRGALVGPVYAILLLLVALFGSSTVHVGQNTIMQLHPSVGHAILMGLIWGTLLGALGGLLAIRRHHLFTTNRQPDLLAGASWGALVALGSGLLLILVALVVGMVAHVIGTSPSAEGASGSGIGGVFNAVVTTIALLIVVAPVGALWLFALGTGATIDSWLTASGAAVRPDTSTFGLLFAQHHPTSPAWWLLLLIPLVSYIIGGRAAAHIARADSLRDAALVGWLMAVALSVLMLVLTLLTRVLISSEAILVDRSITTSLGIGPSVLPVFLLVLIVGGILGAAGGASAIVAPEPVPLLASVGSPVLARLDPAASLAQRPWDMLDAARNRRSSRTTLAVLLYAAALSAVLLVALFLIVLFLGWIASHFAPIAAVRGFDGFFAGLAVAVPLVLLASAAILVVMRTLPPLLARHHTKDTPVIPRYPRP